MRLLEGHIELQEAVVGSGLDVGQRRNLDRIAEAAEIAYFFRVNIRFAGMGIIQAPPRI